MKFVKERRFHVNCRMKPGDVVEAFDVFGDVGLGLPPRAVDAAIDELFLEGREEALGNGVVETIALMAHGRAHAVLPQRLAIVATRVLLRFKWSSQRAIVSWRLTVLEGPAAAPASSGTPRWP